MSCVIVLGCFRTGTSAVAGVLHHLGVMMGKEFDAPARSNPKGYYEDVEFKDLYSKLAEGREVEGSLQVLIRLREAEYPLWGVKDPQLCLLLHKFVPLLRTEHRIISMVRAPGDICHSLNRAVSGATATHDFLPLVDYYLTRKEAALSVYGGPVLEVNFAEIGADPVALVEKVAAFAGVPVRQEAIDHVRAA